MTSAEADMIVRPPFLIDRPECEDRGRVARGPAGVTLAPMMLRGGWRHILAGRPIALTAMMVVAAGVALLTGKLSGLPRGGTTLR